LKASGDNMGLPIAPNSLAGRLSRSSTAVANPRPAAAPVEDPSQPALALPEARWQRSDQPRGTVADVPGGSPRSRYALAWNAEVARRHGISTGLLYTWRKQVLAGLLGGLMPVRIVANAESGVRYPFAGAAWRSRAPVNAARRAV
jgi:hypothetical protein